MGEQLSTLDQSELITVTAAETCYCGEVVGINRQQFDLVAGFMKDAYIGVQLRVDNESVKRNGLQPSICW